MSERAFDITLDPALAYRIAELAREYAAEETLPRGDDDLPDEGFDEDSLSDEEDVYDEAPEPPSDPIESELRALIDGLNVDAQKDLLALIWLGRDGSGAKDWSRIRHQATDTSDLHVAQYLEETPLASDYLIEGLLSLGYESDE